MVCRISDRALGFHAYFNRSSLGQRGQTRHGKRFSVCRSMHSVNIAFLYHPQPYLVQVMKGNTICIIGQVIHYNGNNAFTRDIRVFKGKFDPRRLSIYTISAQALHWDEKSGFSKAWSQRNHQLLLFTTTAR